METNGHDTNGWLNDQHWKVVHSGGRQINNTPQQLWDNALQYFQWCDENTIKAKKVVSSGKKSGESITMEFVRPYTIDGLCLHCSISKKWLSDIKESHAKDSEWYLIMEKIMMIIYTQNLEGAIVDIYNPIIVSKVLKLDNGDDGERTNTVRVEIVNSTSNQLSNSENEVLKKLDLEKVNLLNEKVENSER